MSGLVAQAGGRATVSHIYNGYDRADLPLLDEKLPSADGRLRLAYVGTLWNLTSIEPIVEAIRRVATRRPELAARIELTVAGRSTAEQDEILNRLSDTPCRLIREGYVDHQRAIQIMSDSDELCLLLSGVAEAGRVVPAKTFEYLALGRSILAVVPPGEVGDILKGCPQASIRQPTDVTGIADYLTQRLEQPHASLLTRKSSTMEAAGAERFERRELTRQLAETLDRTCGVKHAPSASIASREPEEVVI